MWLKIIANEEIFNLYFEGKRYRCIKQEGHWNIHAFLFSLWLLTLLTGNSNYPVNGGKQRGWALCRVRVKEEKKKFLTPYIYF